MKHTRWYKDRVFYQIWPRSFADGNGDGIGDLWGVLEKLDYLKELGIGGIWFSPLYPSPNADCGYDISDYKDIAPEYGGMAAFEKVLEEAHKRDMKVIMDLVVNHTSDEHEWFRKSRERIDPYTDYYIWRSAGKNGRLPNNWDSHFEGKAWSWDEVRQEYYMHLFAVKQPDLNMDNHFVREEVKNIMDFWLSKGVDGFREDVITFISKKEGLPNDRLLPIFRGIFHYNHGPHLHEYLQEFKHEVLSRYDCVTIAEAPLVSPRKALEYVDEDGSNDFDMMIQFQCMCGNCLFLDYIPTPFSLRRLKYAFSSWQRKLNGKGWNLLYLENHDHPRVVSRYGSEQYRVESAKMLCASYMFQQGTPFVYQGQELGMTNWYPEHISEYEDVQTLNNHTNWPEEKRLKLYHRASRDSARTPMQWNSEDNAGFTTGTPWFHVNENYREINAADQLQDKDSVLAFYKKTIALRKKLAVVKNGMYREYMRLSGKVYMYTRTDGMHKLLVVASYSEKPVRVSPAFCTGFTKTYFDKNNCVLSNYPASENGAAFTMRPYEVRVYYCDHL